MAANKTAERFAPLTLAMPAGVNIASGAPLMLGTGSHSIAMVALEAQNTTNPPYDPNSGFLSCDLEGAYALSVTAETLGSVSAGAAINVGDKVYFSGGTYDKTTGITYGGVLCVDTNGDFFGIALAPVAAGTTATISVLLKNAAC